MTLLMSHTSIRNPHRYILWNRVLNILAAFNYMALLLFITVLLTALSEGRFIIGNEICRFIAPCLPSALVTLFGLGIICPIVYLIRDGNHSVKCFSLSAAIVLSVAGNVFLSNYCPNTLTVSVFLVILAGIFYKECIGMTRRSKREMARYTIEDILISMDILYVCALLIHSS